MFSLSIVCRDYNTCGDVEVHCPSAPDSTCDIECSSEKSCYPLRMFADDGYQGLVLNNNDSFNNIISLCDSENELSCKQLSFREQVDCDAALNCNIDCTSVQCVSRVINATLATSLYLDCAGSSCVGSVILCPSTPDASCFVRCVECDYAQIEVATDYSFTRFVLECEADYLFGCTSMKVSLSALSIQNISISCSGNYVCNGLDVSIASTAVVSTFLTCDGAFSCTDMSLSVPDGVVSVTCNGNS